MTVRVEPEQMVGEHEIMNPAWNDLHDDIDVYATLVTSKEDVD
jgi:hypothetical protein